MTQKQEEPRTPTEPTTDRHAEELRQLRLQMNSLASQLSITTKQPEEVQGRNARRRGRSRRGSHSPWWKKIASKLGLR